MHAELSAQGTLIRHMTRKYKEAVQLKLKELTRNISLLIISFDTQQKAHYRLSCFGPMRYDGDSGCQILDMFETECSWCLLAKNLSGLRR